MQDDSNLVVGSTPDSEMLTVDSKIKVHCCICGILIEPNPSNRCINCIKSKVDIAEGITKQIIIYKCRN